MPAFEIPDKISREEFDGLPDRQKPIFVQSSGDPNIYEYAVPQLANSMRNAKVERDAEKRAREAAEEKARAYEKFGDPKEIEDLRSREALIRDGTKTLEDAIMRAKREAEDRYNSIVSEKSQRIIELEAARIRDHEGSLLQRLVASSGADPAYTDEIMLSFGRQLKTEVRDGRLQTYVMDPENPKELAKDPQTFDPLTPERAFQLFREKKAKFFKGETDGQSGAGFNGGRGSGGGDSFDSDPLTWSFATKKAFFDTMGQNARQAYDKKLAAWDQKRQAQRKAS